MKIMNSALRIPSSALEGWLPDMDLNHDKQIQSLLCYRYTIGQAGASGRLKGFIDQSSRHPEAEVNKMRSVADRPHRGPLPQERENASPLSAATIAPGSLTRLEAHLRKTATAHKTNETPKSQIVNRNW